MNRSTRLVPMAVVALVAAAIALPASGFTADILCTSGQNLIVGTDGNDRLRGTRADDCMIGGAGNDRLAGSRGDDTISGGPGDDRIAGGAGNDVIEPGPGKDIVNAGPGDDLIIIRAVCELEPRSRISGGPGHDTLRTPVGLAELRALGVRVRSVETVEIVPSIHDGACVEGPDGIVCSCCNDPNADPESGCSACVAGYAYVNPQLGAGDLEGTFAEAGCVPVATCAERDCGDHGTCVEGDGGGVCACDPGYAGSACETCAPLYQEIAPGTCALGEACARERCGGHGVCVREDDAILCQCDDGWDLDANCGGESVLVGGPRSLIAGMGPQTYSVSLANGAHCTTNFVWSVSRGTGTLVPDPAGAPRAAYTPPTRTTGAVEHVRLDATCGNDATLGGRVDISVSADPVAGSHRGLPVTGSCDPQVAAAFDEAMISYMLDNEIVGGTLAVTYQEEVVCVRGYGFREAGFTIGGPFSMPEITLDPMRPCTPMRVASVSKPFTRAAFRGNLFGQAIPAALGGGTVGETTPLLPLVANTIGLGPNGEVPMQLPAGFYGATYPTNLPGTGVTCNAGDGLIHPSWNGMNINNVLAHRAGFTPNQSYQFVPGSGGCNGTATEVCGTTAGPGDPTISSIVRMNNDLGIVAYGEPTLDDSVRWLAGLCPFDTPAANRFRYSNAGFTVAGKAIENLTGQTYEDFLVDFLTDDGIIGIDTPGSPIVYLGQDKGGGPRTYALPDFMRESEYWTPRADATDVTAPVFDVGLNQWTFPSTSPNAYGGRNYAVMSAHGGLVMNALALAKFGSTYLIRDGSPRDTARGGPGLTFYDDNPGNFHGGRLPGVAAMTWEFEMAEPPITTNINGIGCVIRDDITDADSPTGNGLDVLEVEPCVLPPGIRVSVLFNTDLIGAGSADFVRGRHDAALLGHMVRLAAARVGQTAAEWDSVQPLNDRELETDCSINCSVDASGVCVPALCGNGVLDPGEECDDGNNISGDACNDDCTLPGPPASEPGGYDDCAGEAPGTCLGGPCAPREMQFVNDSDRLDWFSDVHPDGDYSRTTFCHDFQSMGLPWDEATCVRTLVNGKPFGVCQECGVDTMTGCVCPAPNAEDGGCNTGGNFNGYDCVGGRCWQGLPPNWMCTADCSDIYGASGACHHDDAKGASCYDVFCDEPVPTYCAEMFGAVCNPAANGCNNDSCCTAECLNDDDCTNMGFSPGHMCVQERCKLAP